MPPRRHRRRHGVQVIRVIHACIYIYTRLYIRTPFDSQVLPRRLDWQGNEHEQTFEELVSVFIINQLAFQSYRLMPFDRHLSLA